MKILPIITFSTALTLGTMSYAFAQDQTGPAASPNAASNPAVKSPDHMTGAPLAKGHNSFTEAEARARMLKAGYANVSNLALDSDGLWHANATHGGQPVNVALDYKGNIAAQ
jgi:hypothetical protein